MKDLIAIIPARGGSKEIPRKNIKNLAGKPLIAWTIEAAIQSSCIDKLIVSTEDSEIAKIAQDYGAEVPFLRPQDLANDDALSIDVVINVLEIFRDFKWTMMLQPTSPLRTSEDIINFTAFCKTKNVNSVVSICQPTQPPQWMYQIDENDQLIPILGKPLTPRQKLPEAYVLNGALYLSKTTALIEEKSFVTSETIGYLMPQERSIDIDNNMDWAVAECFLRESKRS